LAWLRFRINERNRVRGQAFPAKFSRATFPFPEEPKTSPVPLDNSIGLHDPQPNSPSAPGVETPSPKGTVEPVQTRPSGGSAQYQQLVAQGQVFQQQVSTRFQDGCGEAK
jgi:hypothetical protein